MDAVICIANAQIAQWSVHVERYVGHSKITAERGGGGPLLGTGGTIAVRLTTRSSIIS